MTSPLSLGASRRADGTAVLTVTGEIDLSNNQAFTHALATVVAETGNGTRIILDLSGVEFLDSGAINTLFTHAEHIHLIANPILMPVLTVSGLTELLTVEQV
ncbi:STAS domain-containing protein [Nocardia sp. BMG111209]|uniref:STAS domain-containing protein n=1 Tax=Nocardia sp. BMG111209 TaxID=1160137 RepID=UPI00035F8832|nr:STAS domain-containing protein [Nocardia sp. BMG111209]